MKKLVLLDLDNTLFDSASYRKKIFTKIALLLDKNNVQVTEKKCEEIYDDLRLKSGIFSPYAYIEELVNRYHAGKKTKKEITDIVFSQETLRNNLYSEVIDSLKEISRHSVLGIFSQGIQKIQHAKLFEIKHFFHKDHIHIVENKEKLLESVFGKYKNYKILVVDDALQVLYALKQAYPSVFVIWMRRGRYAEKQKDIKGFIPDAIVEDMNQAVRVIKKLIL